MKSKIYRAFVVVLIWAIALNVIYEIMLIFMVYTPFSRVGALFFAVEHFPRRNYTNTVLVNADDLVGSWKVESLADVYSGAHELRHGIKFELHEDQTFEFQAPASLLEKPRWFFNSPPHLPDRLQRDNSGQNDVYIKGKWGIYVQKLDKTTKKKMYSTLIVVKYDEENEYVVFGEILDKHRKKAGGHFAIKWRMSSQEIGPATGIYFAKNHFE